MDQGSGLLRPMLKRRLTQRGPYWGGQATGSPSSMATACLPFGQLLNVPCQPLAPLGPSEPGCHSGSWCPTSQVSPQVTPLLQSFHGSLGLEDKPRPPSLAHRAHGLCPSPLVNRPAQISH